MVGYSRGELILLLSMLFVLIVVCKCTKMKVYKCDNDINPCGCTRRPHLSLKILGGESGLFSNWDWMASIRNMNDHFCGGSILNEWYIITAAHCFDNITNLTSELTVCSGTFRLSDPCHQRRIIDYFIIHPEFNITSTENDLALIRLQTPLDLSDLSITPICLPNENSSSEDLLIETEVVSIGWGHIKSNKIPDVLQQVTLKIMDKSSIFCSYIPNEQIQLCVGDFGKGNHFYQIYKIDFIIRVYRLRKFPRR